MKTKTIHSILFGLAVGDVIIGKIEIVNAYFGTSFKPSNNEDLNSKIERFRS